MVVRVSEQHGVPRWLLLLLAVESTVIIGLIAGIVARVCGSNAIQAVTIGFVAVGGCFSMILGAIAFLSEPDYQRRSGTRR